MAEPKIPEGSVLDPDVEQSLADLGIWWVIMPDGTRTAWNGDRHAPLSVCPVCLGQPDKMPDCADCRGTGEMKHVPFCDRPWDEVLPGLWLGGHDCQPTEDNPRGDALPDDHFDVVVSLYQRGLYSVKDENGFPTGEQVDFDPVPGTKTYFHRMADSDLDPEHHGPLDFLAGKVTEHVKNGEKVLVRCQAGINRSALVCGLAMVKMGWTPNDAIDRMREVRTPYVLFNQSFAAYLRGAHE